MNQDGGFFVLIAGNDNQLFLVYALTPDGAIIPPFGLVSYSRLFVCPKDLADAVETIDGKMYMPEKYLPEITSKYKAISILIDDHKNFTDLT